MLEYWIEFLANSWNHYPMIKRIYPLDPDVLLYRQQTLDADVKDLTVDIRRTFGIGGITQIGLFLKTRFEEIC